MKLFSTFRMVVLGSAFAAAVASVGCAQPEQSEELGHSTAKLLAPYKAMQTPASVTSKFVKALGGVPVDINGWKGYVAGTINGQKKDDALFAMHLSGVKGEQPVAGLTIAFVEGTPSTGELSDRIKNASSLEVRFNNGSSIVSTHNFADGSTNAAHQNDPNSDSLLKRAFNDSNALLAAPTTATASTDDSKACLANYLTTVSHATRCVNDANNTDECSMVRDSAVATAATCAGTDTANILANAGSTSTVHTDDFNLGSALGLFSSFFSILGPGLLGAPAAAAISTPLKAITGLLGAFSGAQPAATSLLSPAGGLMGLFSKFFPTGTPSLLPQVFGQPTAATSILASPLTGGVNVLQGGGLGLPTGIGF